LVQSRTPGTKAYAQKNANKSTATYSKNVNLSLIDVFIATVLVRSVPGETANQDFVLLAN
jgi:hypothetical protein